MSSAFPWELLLIKKEMKNQFLIDGFEEVLEGHGLS